MRAARRVSESDIYHVMSRGAGRQLIFEDDEDRERCLSLLGTHLERTPGKMLAWCFMENHLHLLLCIPCDDLSMFMRRFLSDYALYFNRRHGREGHLFQDRFLSEPVEKDDYLLSVARYIHQNPEKAGLSKTRAYPWSSYGEYTGVPLLCDTDLVLSMLGGIQQFVSFHEEFDEGVSPLEVRFRRNRMSDEQCLSRALELFGDAGLGEIKALPKAERDEAIRTLKGEGLTVRQIQRLTGVSLGSISKA